MSIRFIAVMFGGLLVGCAGSVVGPDGRLLMCGGRSPMSLTRLGMSLCGRMVGGHGALEGLIGTLLRALHGQGGGGLTAGQIGSSLLQLFSTCAGPFRARRGVLAVRPRFGGHACLNDVVPSARLYADQRLRDGRSAPATFRAGFGRRSGGRAPRIVRCA